MAPPLLPTYSAVDKERQLAIGDWAPAASFVVMVFLVTGMCLTRAFGVMGSREHKLNNQLDGPLLHPWSGLSLRTPLAVAG